MNGFTVVAIPQKDDYVWRISSDKVPHLTILHLGEDVQDFAGMVSFLGHVVNTTMCRFGLSVAHRGVLGEKEADVLFFDKHYTRTLSDVRSYLLTNPDIERAYNSTEQFPEYTPHLTLGYPETPAKPDNRDYPGINWINFDRIALWTGDFEGPEFFLDDAAGWEVSMSDIDERVEEILSHFGVKGMKWGTRRSKKQLGEESADFRTATASAAKAKKGGTKSLSNAELKTLIERMNLEQQYTRVVPPSTGAKWTRAGGKFAGDVLLGVGKAQATKIANDQATKVLAGVFKK